MMLRTNVWIWMGRGEVFVVDREAENLVTHVWWLCRRCWWKWKRWERARLRGRQAFGIVLFYFLETLQECSHGIFLQLRRLDSRAFSRTDIFSWAGCKLCAACCQQFWHYVNKMKLVFGIPGSQKAYGAGNTSSWWSWQRGQLPTVTESGLKVMSTWCSNSKKEWRLFSTYILK